MLEDKGYDVIFSKVKVFLRHTTMGQVNKIGIRVQNIYKIEVEDCVALSSKEENMLSRDVGELWHMRLGHLHHGALKILWQISTGFPKGTLEQVVTCKVCTLRKYTKSSFEDRDIRANSILERVHSDVCGPFSTISTAKHSVWDVVLRPEDKSVVNSCWIYKVKQATDGSVEKHKSRFVARGFSWVEGIDYDENFALVARYSSIRSILALSTQMGWSIHQMDVNTAFFNGMIKEEVYIEQLEGFETLDHESHVC
eukprot:PITA_33020